MASLAPLYLDVGCGDRPYEDGIHDWVHLDERPLPHVEYVGDAEDLRKCVGETTCREILARHILEHFSWRDTVRILENWRSCLVPGGQLRIEVPNFEWQSMALASAERSDEEMVEYVFGSQDYPGNFHKAAFTPRLLAIKLAAANFDGIEIRDIGQVVLGSGYRPV